LQVVPDPAPPALRIVGALSSEAGGGVSEGSGEVAPPASGEDLAGWAERLARIRFAARQAKDWARADAARALLQGQDFEVRDTKEGVQVVPRRKAPG